MEVPHNFSEEEVLRLLEAQGYTRIHARHGKTLEVVQDRFRLANAERARVIEALEAALRVGQGRVAIYPLGEDGAPATPWKFSTDLHCADCDIHYAEPAPSSFSFNSPLGACETCRGFGRVIGLDFGLVVPDESKTLAGGAVKPWQTESSTNARTTWRNTRALRGSAAWTHPWRELSAEAPALGARGRAGVGELAQVLAGSVVRRWALLRLAGEQSVQDAHPGAAVELPRLHALRRRAPDGGARLKRRVAAVEAGCAPAPRLQSRRA